MIKINSECRGHSTVWSVLLITISACLLFGNGCDQFDKIVPPVDEPIRDNPRDPDPKATNPQPPETTIISGPTSNEIVTENIVNFSWQGNLPSMDFQFRRDSADWSEWSAQTSVNIGPLSEGEHSFEVRAGYSRFVFDETPAQATFIVDAITGPALRLSPPDTTIIANEVFEIWLMAEEVSDLMAISSIISYDPGILSIVSLQAGSFLESNGGRLYQLPAPSFNLITETIEINMAIGEASPPGVSGSGVILIIRFRGTTPGVTQLSIISASMRDHLNNTILPLQLVSASITIR